jgi:hypothetical protein
MINNVGGRLSEGSGSVVAEGHNTSIGKLLGEEVFQPECVRFWMGPGFDRIAAQSVHGHDARARPGYVRKCHLMWITTSGSQGCAYSIVEAVVDPFG